MSKNLYELMPQHVQRNLKRKVFVAGTPIILSGLDNSNVYFLIKGTAEASVSNSNGGYVTLYIYSPISVFGEAEPFYEGIHKPVSITALTDCTVDILYKNDFLQWLSSDFEATKVLIYTLTQKLVHNSVVIEDLLHLRVQDRILRCIAIHDYKNTITELTKKQLALEANVPIRSLNRSIARCARDNILCYHDKHFQILNPSELVKYLPCYLLPND